MSGRRGYSLTVSLCVLLLVLHRGSLESAGRSPDETVIVEKGVRVAFSVEPAYRSPARRVMEGENAVVRFRITDAQTGEPVSPLQPAVWISQSAALEKDLSCKERIARYLQGMLSFRADVDLNKYFILVLNNDHSISVIDPLQGVSGITQLYAMVLLEESGEDWVMSPDKRTLFVTMPEAHRLAVVDLETFKVARSIDSGQNPVRVAVQPDGRYLWVGNDGEDSTSGVTVIDARSYAVVAHVPTGAGHHQLAFSADSLFAFVTNGAAATLSVIDTQALKKLKDVPTGEGPVAVQFSPLSQSVYVASRGDGTITVVDGARHLVSARIPTEPGLASFRLARGWRWGFAANAEKNRVDVVDVARGRVAHRFAVGAGPHQFAFTDTYAYVRHLGTPQVTLIPLAQLGKGPAVGLQTIAFGSRAPGDGRHPASVADSIAPTGEWSSVVAANPADSLVYYYMEGMVAPMGSYPTYGRIPRAVGVVNRSVRETERGVYSATFRVPKDGDYTVAFLIDSPWVDHCFRFSAEINPRWAAERQARPVQVDFLQSEKEIAVGEKTRVRFRLARSGDPLAVGEVMVLATRLPGHWQRRQRAESRGEGVYEAELTLEQAGTYYFFVSLPSLDLDFTELPYLSLRVVERRQTERAR